MFSDNISNMFLRILFTTWVLPLVKANSCELYKTSLMLREQCKALCDYISPCDSFTYSTTTHLCSVWNSPGYGRRSREHTLKDLDHPCSTRPCDVTDICIPVTGGTQFKCLPFDSTCSCGQPDLEVNNATLVSTPDIPIDSSMALYECNKGFQHVEGSNAITCHLQEWSRLSIVCHEITCKRALWSIPNATSTTALTSKFGDNVTYTCAIGYINTGGSDTSFCQENGEWSTPAIECKVIQCPEDVPIIGNTTINMTSRTFADIVTYSCVDGYKYFGGQNTSVCQESGNWSAAGIVCAEWEEWGKNVLNFSSQYIESSWHAVQILGKFDVYPQYGDFQRAWAPSDMSCRNGTEWIQVEFAEMLYIRRIDIYETYTAGLVKTVSVERDGTWNIIWTATTVALVEHSRIFSPQFTPLTFPSNRVMFKTNCTSVAGHWVEFDAIKIFGLTSPPRQTV